MNLEDELVQNLGTRAEKVLIPPSAWQDHKRRVQRRTAKRVAVGGAVGGALTAVSAVGLSTLNPNSSGTPVGQSIYSSPSPSNTAPPMPVAAEAVLDGVAVSGFPDGYKLLGPPHSQNLMPGTRTRLDVVVGPNGEGGGSHLSVYRDSDWTINAATRDVLESNHVPGGTSGQLTASISGDDHIGVVTWTDAAGHVDHRTGYVRLSPNVFLVVGNTIWDDDVVRRVLASAHLG